MAIRILTDSSSDLDPEEYIEKDIICVPLTITFGDESFLDGPELSKDEFYRRLLERGLTPQTSQPSPEEFLQEFLEAKEAGDDLIAILLTTALSGTVQSAMIARHMADYDRITVIDSLTAVTGLRMLLDIAVKMRAEGAAAADIAAMVAEVQPRIRIFAVLDTLEYLHRGGRLGKTAAAIGELVNIKPIIFVDNDKGNVNLSEICVGKDRAARKLMSIFEQEEIDLNYPVYFPYTYNKEYALKFIEMIKPKYPYLDSKHCYNLGPTIGTHIGDGGFGFTYIAKEKFPQTS